MYKNMTNEIAVYFSALIEPPSGGQKVSAFYSQSHFATLPQQLSEAHSAQTHRSMPIRCTYGTHDTQTDNASERWPRNAFVHRAASLRDLTAIESSELALRLLETMF